MIGLVLPLTACQQTNKASNTPTTTSKSATSQSVEPVAYSDLTKAQQAKVFFKFKALSDIASGDGDHNMPAPLVVDMTVKNNGKQNVSFNLAKFLMFDAKGNAPTVKSAKTGTLKLKPGETQKIHSIFENVSSQALLGTGAFYYMNVDFKLAYYLNAANAKGVDSNNLKSGKAKNLNEKAQEKIASTSESSSSRTDNNETVQQNSASSQDQPEVQAAQTQQAQGITAQEAVNIVRRIHPIDDTTENIGVNPEPTTSHSGRLAWWVTIRQKGGMAAGFHYTVYLDDGSVAEGQPFQPGN
ncbi:hypothetical protein FC83_GL002602 [Agrilactobacillus composti DSM 18527 = JCM 14202]|uniref:DUF4352 domain-containing protein n=1 Tax=Agrilactobacillus composti DSM 18527 = JCM 14202 TaxID=1423734 RepID=X0PU54_9LACO|nr:hypothetical protein [Agrilactobacillus composti]KRM36727.1 hypothetical protein FC83_GL002602 [Agrilactobacillus composti DSM 18527 = JCM 14202]GAF41592.1 hypothetical protein JCM14202_3542 [Agrilactobacillus composti DSM 18527 = JCM 14202]